MENGPNQEATSLLQAANLMLNNLPEQTSNLRKNTAELLDCFGFKDKKVDVIDNFSFSNVEIKDECVDLPNYDVELNDFKIEQLPGNIYTPEHYKAGCADLYPASSLKTENIESSNGKENMHKISFYKWKIKNEEFDIKEEDLTQTASRSNDLSPLALKIEETVSSNINGKMHEIPYNEWKIKNEELKDEDLTQNTLRILPNCFDYGNQEVHSSKTGTSDATFREDSLQRHLLQHERSEDVYKYNNDHCVSITLPKSNSKTQLPQEIKKIKCDHCNYATLRKSSLKRHLLQHKKPEEVNKYKCDHCNFRTLRKDNLKTHLLRHKNPEEVSKFKCDHCNYRTHRIGHFKTHLLIHKNPDEVSNFKCDQCNYRTFRKGHLNLHLLRHKNPEEVNRFKCDHCDYSSIHKFSLKLHFLQHKRPEEVSKFKCDHCNYTSIHKSSLKSHSLQHKRPEEVIKFQCDHCNYSTRHKSSLKLHLFQHNNPEEVSEFKCAYCNYSTIRKCNLKIHILRHKKSRIS